MLVDHLFWYRISLWPKTAEKREFCTGVMDQRTNRWTDRWTDHLTEMRSQRTHLKTRLFTLPPSCGQVGRSNTAKKPLTL